MNKRTFVVPGFGLCFLLASFLAAGGGLDADAASAASLPGVRVLGSISDKFKPVTFDHAKHVSIADGCATCHHQHQDSKKLNCKECHALDQAAFKNSVKSNFLACSSCHGAPDPAAPAMPGLKVAYHKQCFQCHRGMGNIGTDPKGCAELCHARKAEKTAMKLPK